MTGLQYVRENFNMSIATLSKQMGISYQAISQWEKGIRQIPAKRINELSAIFGIPEQYFLELKDSDVKELDTLIQTAKAQAEESYLFSEYENLLKAERKTISKIDSHLKRKEISPESFQELIESMEREIKRFEKYLDVASCSEFQFILDPILDVFIKQQQIGGDRVDLIQSLRKEITAVLNSAEEIIKENNEMKNLSEELDDLY